MYDEFMKNYDMSIDQADIVKMEEKKAIGLLEALNNLEKECKIEKVPYNSEIKKIAISLLPEDYRTFETILNLIKKLQNENKELKAGLYSANSIINEYVDTYKDCISKEIELSSKDVKAMLEKPEKYFKIRIACYKE